MKRIIINFEDDMTDMEALMRVGEVVKLKKVSNDGKQYAYAVGFTNGFTVYCGENKNGFSFKIVRD